MFREILVELVVDLRVLSIPVVDGLVFLKIVEFVLDDVADQVLIKNFIVYLLEHLLILLLVA